MHRLYSCVDKETGYDILLIDTSYNNACFWLENNGLKIENCESITLNSVKITGTHKESGNKHEFIYDEIPGKLLQVS